MSSGQNPIENPSAQHPPKAESAKVVEPIIYDLPPHETASKRVDHLLRETEKKFTQRAARFGATTTRTPSDVHVLGARRANVRVGFVTGFDTSTDLEKQKREHRKKRFETGPEIDDPEKRRSRAERFGINPAAVKDGKVRDPLESRRDVAIGELMRENAIHVFGVDEMSTKEVMSHFVDYGPSWCEWLNDSSCNVLFEDAFTMRRVLNDATNNLDEKTTEDVSEAPVDKMGDDEGDGVSMHVAGEGSLPEEAKWRVARPFMKRGSRIPLWVRQASEQDVRPEAPNPKSHWSTTMRKVRHRHKDDGRREGMRSRPRSHRSGMQIQRQQSGASGGQSISLGVHKDRAASIMKARMKKVSKEDLFKPLAS